MSRPWSFDEAWNACREASRDQEAAEDGVKDAARAAAQAEERYRKALAVKIVQLHNDGVAWSVTADLARGDEGVAALKRERDTAAGALQATEHAAWRRNADRKDAQRFADWSQRRELAEGYGQLPEPEASPVIGRAA